MGDLVSTIIPVFNRAEYLAEAFDSVIKQTYRPVEIILVDDGSTDGTAKVVDELAIRYPDIVRVIHQKNGGPGVAREAGRKIAQGEFIQYLDSDDVLLPNKFQEQVDLLKANPDCGIAYGITSLVDDSLNVLESVHKDTGIHHEYLLPRLLVERWWNTHTPLFRRSVTDAIGPWPAMRMSEDWVYDARAGAMEIKLCHCSKTLSLTRQHFNERLTTQGLKPHVLADTARLLPELFEASQRAGVHPNDSALDHLARWSFLETRRCGAAGLIKEAATLHQLSSAISISGKNRKLRMQLRVYRVLSLFLGWQRLGALSSR